MANASHKLVTHDRSRAAVRTGVLATLTVALVWTSTSGSALADVDTDVTTTTVAGDHETSSAASRSLERTPLPVTAAPEGTWDTQEPEDSITVVSRAEREAAEKAVADAIAAEEAERAAEAQAILDAEAKAKADAEEAARPAVVASTSYEISEIKAYASGLVGGGDQFACLDALWTKESGWNYTADNPSSSAYGIPQALPGSKMASAGADWATNPQTQVRWGVSYIAGRYGTACAAWAHSQEVNWY
ncbi:transglycosylase domain-containing protein [Sanguibacter antarcticus]|uniref:Transglycosylase-like protein with SLT domain n=1 Tax=Sanguibacter antarcticus TaxID=372484 RepID=A0A2A9E8F0_9MICO|nr:transglycosylase domain-containing protein [Sanguibacter antarcticus]PFG34509.1 hypothetical protein ATL42_2420 [Sanguibacter antarcticus]